MRLRRLLVACVLFGGLAACGDDSDVSGDGATRVKLAAGQCFAREADDLGDPAPDFTSLVPCTEPHTYEILGLTKVPAALTDMSSPGASLKRRDALARVEGGASALQRKLNRHAAAKCGEFFSKVVGTAGMPWKRGVTGADVVPVFQGLTWANLAPRDLWGEGKTDIVCSVRYGDREGDGQPRLVRSTSAEPLIASILTADFPDELRYCLNGAEDEVSCAALHVYEIALVVDVEAMLGPGIVDGEKSLADFQRLEGLCGAMWVQLGFSPPGRQYVPFAAASEEMEAKGLTECYTIRKSGEKDIMMPFGFQTIR